MEIGMIGAGKVAQQNYLPALWRYKDGSLTCHSRTFERTETVWAKHGVMACSDVSVKRAADRLEYAETAAKYEYLNLTDGDWVKG